jgi:AcrR family transcriptional regulator
MITDGWYGERGTMARTVGSNGPKTMEAIRKAGLRLIYSQGYEAMSLRKLAAEVGIQAGSLYNHITTKQDLLFDLIKVHMDELLERLDQALDGISDPEDRLQSFIAFHVGYHIARKREVFICYSELRSLEPKNYEIVVSLRQQYERKLIDILDDGIAEGRFTVADTTVAAYGILAMLTGVCTWFRPAGRMTKEEVVGIYTGMVRHGLVRAADQPISAERLTDSPAVLQNS